jgi:hypothetical protein
MDDTEILLSSHTQQYMKYQAASNIIKTHNLSINYQEILTAFKKIRKSYGYIHMPFYKNRLFLMRELLIQNPNMYIAHIKALNDNFDPDNSYQLLITDQNYIPIKIGILNDHSSYRCNCVYFMNLLNYYSFDVTELEMSNQCKLIIQQYHQKKYNGNLTKSAKKNE